jgi:hypothetical protein
VADVHIWDADTKQSTNNDMTTLRQNAALALLTIALFGCAEPQPQVTSTTTTTTTTVRTIQTTQAIHLTIGMKGTDAIALAGIPCAPATLKQIDEGDNVTLKYQGHAYVFCKGVLQAVQ